MEQTAILVAANIINEGQNIEYELTELENLSKACGILVLDKVVQNLSAIHPKYYVGKGKIDEVKELAIYHDADVVIFNDELSPAQIRSIEKQLERTVFDRTFIILEIFSRRAQTKEAILQVEIATLNYLLPRLVGMREGLSRQRGQGGSFHRGRGGGETKLELDRRQIQTRTHQLKQELKSLIKLRAQQRQRRKANLTPVVSIVGYTNSGKSTLLNALLEYSTETKRTVFEKDMLFATLETATRKVKLENRPEFLVTDTVGFVQKLPHQLVEAFKSTLEEITESDLIIHVVDSPNEEYIKQINITNDVLKQIGVIDIPIIYAFNKMDLINDDFYIEPHLKPTIKISAKEKTGIKELIDLILNNLFDNFEECTFLIPFTEGHLINHLKENSQVFHTDYRNNGTLIKANVSNYFKNKYKEYRIE